MPLLLPYVCLLLLLFAAAWCCCSWGIRPSLTPMWWPLHTVIFRCVLKGLDGMSNCLHSLQYSTGRVLHLSTVTSTTPMHCHHQAFPLAFWFFMFLRQHLPSLYPAHQNLVSRGPHLSPTSTMDATPYSNTGIFHIMSSVSIGGSATHPHIYVHPLVGFRPAHVHAKAGEHPPAEPFFMVPVLLLISWNFPFS